MESTARYLMLARRDRRVEDEEGMVYLFAVVGHLCHCCLECCDSSNQAEWVELRRGWRMDVRGEIGSAGGLDDVKRIISDFVYYARVHNNYAIPRQARLPEVDAALRGRFTLIYLPREPL